MLINCWLIFISKHSNSVFKKSQLHHLSQITLVWCGCWCNMMLIMIIIIIVLGDSSWHTSEILPCRFLWRGEDFLLWKSRFKCMMLPGSHFVDSPVFESTPDHLYHASGNAFVPHQTDYMAAVKAFKSQRSSSYNLSPNRWIILQSIIHPLTNIYICLFKSV